jgi:hypothetical protein
LLISKQTKRLEVSTRYYSSEHLRIMIPLSQSETMALRIRAPLSGASRYFTARRQYATPSHNASSNHGSHPEPPKSDDYDAPSTSSHPTPAPVDPPIPESTLDSSASKIFSRPVILPRRPAVRPPPTFALPPSMSPPDPSPSLPVKKRAASKRLKASVKEDNKPVVEGDDKPVDELWGIYQESLTERDTEPTLEDLNALCPARHTIKAALDGVLGTGRTMLPEGHQLHLDMEYLGAQEVPVGGGPGRRNTVIAGSRKAKKLEYLALYEATEGHLSRGFTATQLRKFAKDLGIRKRVSDLGMGHSDSKQTVIHRIMNSHFKMMHPEVIKKNIQEVMGKTEESSYHHHSPANSSDSYPTL